MHHPAVLRLEVVALSQVLEKVAGGPAIHAFFEQSYVDVCNQLLDVNVGLGIPADGEGVELINELLVVDFFDEGRLLKSLRTSAGFKVLPVNQVVGLCVQWVGVAGNDVKV